MAGDADNLTPKQHKAIAALLAEPTIAQAADKVGIGERTLYTWLDDTAFADCYRAARRDAVGQAVARLQQASSDAVTVLVGIMNDTETPRSIRVASAAKVLDTAIKAVELEDLEARIAALEGRINEKY